MQPDLFDLTSRVIIITGSTGVLAGSAACYLARHGARVVFLGRSADKLDAALAACRAHNPQARILACVADVLDRPALQQARQKILDSFGRIDGLVNAAGGNQPGATIPPQSSFFDLEPEAFRDVVNLNLHGTLLPSLVFGEAMTRQKSGAIVNFSSMAAQCVISRVVGYSAAKAAVENFTRWLAVELGRKTAGAVRVNAIAPGFFLSEQNRRLLTNEDGSLTPRGQAILQHTPFGRFGQPEDLHGALQFLLSPASAFVTGISLAVDGGFLPFSGV